MAAPGRLSARSPAASAVRAAPGPGPHPLSTLGLPDHLLLVPEAVGPAAPLVVWFHVAGGHVARTAPAPRETTAGAGAVVLLPPSADATWGLRPGDLVAPLRWWLDG